MDTTHSTAFWSGRRFGRSERGNDNSRVSSRSSMSLSTGDAFNLGGMAKLDSPSAQRNKEPIWEIISSKVLPSMRDVKTLEVLDMHMP